MKKKQLPKNQHILNAVEAINNFIKTNFKILPSSVQDGKKARWQLHRGSAKYFVELYQDDKNEVIFDVISPVLLFPKHDCEGFFKYLLEINASDLTLSRFEISDNIIYLRHSRPITDIDESEILSAIDEVSQLADSYDTRLQDQFGCELYSDSKKVI